MEEMNARRDANTGDEQGEAIRADDMPNNNGSNHSNDDDDDNADTLVVRTTDDDVGRSPMILGNFISIISNRFKPIAMYNEEVNTFPTAPMICDWFDWKPVPNATPNDAAINPSIEYAIDIPKQ